MKKESFRMAMLIATIMATIIVAAAILCGCAALPEVSSPGIYKESRREKIESRRAEADEVVRRNQRADVRHELVLGELQGNAIPRGVEDDVIDLCPSSDEKAAPPMSIGEVVTPHGVAGSFPVIFINGSSSTIILDVEGLKGEFKGQKWSFEIPSERECYGFSAGKIQGCKNFLEYSLETGGYKISFREKRRGEKKERGFNVTPNPHFFFQETGRNYHGGYRVRNL